MLPGKYEIYLSGSETAFAMIDYSSSDQLPSPSNYLSEARSKIQTNLWYRSAIVLHARFWQYGNGTRGGTKYYEVSRSPAPTKLTIFPPELLLEIQAHLTLKFLIAAQGVIQQWRTLVPLADISPHRRDFYEFYMKLVESPIFLTTRPGVLVNLHPFDRQAYLDALLEQ